jgi:DNA-binding PadR family transcriptional regulator
MDFLEIIKTLENIGVSGSKQQAIIWLLWKNGPMSWSEMRQKMGKQYTNFQIHALVSKNLVQTKVSYENRKKKIIYSIKEDALEYLEEAITK